MELELVVGKLGKTALGKSLLAAQAKFQEFQGSLLKSQNIFSSKEKNLCRSQWPEQPQIQN